MEQIVEPKKTFCKKKEPKKNEEIEKKDLPKKSDVIKEHKKLKDNEIYILVERIDDDDCGQDDSITNNVYLFTDFNKMIINIQKLLNECPYESDKKIQLTQSIYNKIYNNIYEYHHNTTLSISISNMNGFAISLD
jgi:hypothetical protein